MNDLAIQTANLTKNFSSVRAVDALSLEVPSGCVFGFLGPNGSGKTTTIRLLLGLIPPSAGTMNVLGFDPNSQGPEIRSRCGALLEHSGLYERLSAEENLKFYGQVTRIPVGQLDARIQHVLERFGLWDRRKEAPTKWSRGMKQKLAIARALLHQPRLVFLDEPTAGLDPIAAASLRDDLTAVASSMGTTIFLTTHNLVEAEKLCALVAVIRRGQLLAIGPPSDLRKRSGDTRLVIAGSGFSDEVVAAAKRIPTVRDAFVDAGKMCVLVKQEADLGSVLSAIAAAGATILEIKQDTGSLEEVFLKLMEEADDH